MKKALSAWRRALAISGGALVSFALTGTALGAGWVGVSSPTSEGLYGVDCSGGNACIAVGNNGTVIYSTSNLTSWSVGTSGTSLPIYDVDAYSSSLAIAAAEDGTLLKSTTMGATWSTVYSSGGVDPFYDVHMASSTVGWAAGEDTHVVKTTNGGATWSELTMPSSIDARALDATSTSNVWIVGTNGNVIKSSNGGTTWTDVSYATTNDVTTIDVVSTSIAFIGGENGMLMKTTDGGTTWNAITLSAFGSSEVVADIVMITSNVGTVIGNGGTVMSTSDGSTFTADTMADSIAGAYDLAAYAVGARVIVGATGDILNYDNYGPNAPANLATEDGDLTDDATPTITWDAATDDEGSSIAYYEVSVDGGAVDTTILPTYTTSTLAEGDHTLTVLAVDEVGNDGSESELSFTVDTTDPTVSSLTPTSATTGTATQFTADASDTNGVASCTLYVNASSVGSMTLDGASGDYYRSHTFSSAGTYSAYALCTDNAGNSVAGATTSVTVTGATTSTDTTAPTVGVVSPSNANVGVTLPLYATYSDAVGVTSCTLYINGVSQGSMTLTGSFAQYLETFSASGTYSAYAACRDAAGNLGTGDTVTITVAAASSEDDEAVDEAAYGDLIKMACPGGEDVNDPCRAVYYYGEDGKRHAFPNEKVFFTWYGDFDDVVIVTDDYMASIVLGRNVTYRPGIKMVKFPSVRTVYAVGESGELRAIDSEEIAISLYGSTWNQKIDDISEAFYGNYTFGTIIDSTSDYDVSDVMDSADTIDDIL